jgi:ATP-dependent RNA helicase DeaD
MIQLTGIRYKGRQVRCNDADDSGKRQEAGSKRRETANRKTAVPPPRSSKKDDWRSLMKKVPRDLRGPEPDFSEEGWALRKPRKKKK